MAAVVGVVMGMPVLMGVGRAVGMGVLVGMGMLMGMLSHMLVFMGMGCSVLVGVLMSVATDMLVIQMHSFNPPICIFLSIIAAVGGYVKGFFCKNFFRKPAGAKVLPV